MSPLLLFTFVISYFALLLLVAWRTSRNANNDSFFIGNKNSNWLLVAFGMVGTSLSGVTFVSVPGTVGTSAFTYYQVVIGYFLGYLAVMYILLPLYYRLNLTSIYSYLGDRFGKISLKTGAMFFILSRTLGATARLYLVINILQIFILDKLGVNFWFTSFIILLLILLYTFEGGVKTIVYTDTLQTSFMLLGLLVCIIAMLQKMEIGFFEGINQLRSQSLTRLFNTDPLQSGFFLKQIIGGAFITITMTGMDQEMMQKNISVKTLKDSQKNMLTLAVVLLVVNFLFLFMGGLLHLYATEYQLGLKGDDLFPGIALGGTLAPIISVLFIIGLISALFPSADGALTAITSSYCIDILGIKQREDWTEESKKKRRLSVHFTFAIIFFICVMIFKWIDDKSIINTILKLAGFTYGPLLGLFAFGILTKYKLKDKLVPYVCIFAPVIMFGLDLINNPDAYNQLFRMNEATLLNFKDLSNKIFHGYKFGVELLVINGLITFLGLWSIREKS